ncbi:MAG: hypothetical protein M5U05_12000 [Anaerolineales bacterium]|nr:hypothetical protein [Anaerolineales bacterium]
MNLQVLGKTGGVGVIADHFSGAAKNRIDRPDCPSALSQIIQITHNSLFVRDGHVQPKQLAAAHRGDHPFQQLRPLRQRRRRIEPVLARNPKRVERRAVHLWREAVFQRVTDQSEAHH